MPSRWIREGILTSEAVDSLSMGAELFYRRLQSVVDDYGRFSGNVKVIKSAAYPLRTDSTSDEQIVGWVNECVSAGLIQFYEVERKPYLTILKFNCRVRAAKSKYPEPPVIESDAEREQMPVISPAKKMPDNCAAEARQVLALSVSESISISRARAVSESVSAPKPSPAPVAVVGQRRAPSPKPEPALSPSLSPSTPAAHGPVKPEARAVAEAQVDAELAGQSPATPGPAQAQEAASLAQIPTPEECVAFGAGPAGIPEAWCRRYHERKDIARTWLNGMGRLKDWRREMVSWWASDRATWGQTGTSSGKLIEGQRKTTGERLLGDIEKQIAKAQSGTSPPDAKTLRERYTNALFPEAGIP